MSEEASLQQYILQKQDKRLKEFEDKDHSFANQLTALNFKMAVVEKKQDIAQENISKLSSDVADIKQSLAKATGAKEIKERIIKIALSLFATFGIGDAIFHFFKTFPV